MRPCAVRAVPSRVLPVVLLIGVLVALVAPGSAAAQLPINVNDTADRPDRSIGDGICATAVGTCTLRAAIQESNALLGHDTVNVPAGTYELEIPSLAEDLASTGDHDIVDSVTIQGVGAGATIIDGGFPIAGAPVEAKGIDRLFEIHPSAGNVNFRLLTIREGYTEESGGAIQNWSPGLLTLDHVNVLDNLAAGSGGGVNNDDPFAYTWPTGSLPPTATIPSGRVHIVDSHLAGNSASTGGAAVNNVSNGTIEIVDSDVVDNPGAMIPDPAQFIDPLDPEPVEYIPAPGVYEPAVSPIAGEGAFEGTGTISVVDSLVARNYVPSNGAGIHVDGDGTLDVVNTIFEKNTTEADGGAIYTNGGRVTIDGSTFRENLAHANAGAYYSGGATSAVGLRSKISITNSTFSKNVAWAAAGAIHSGGDGELTVTEVDVKENEAKADAGGGVEVGDRSSLLMTRSDVTGNHAYGEGGGLFTASERPIIVRDAVISENSAGVPGLEGNDAGGGGLYTEGGPFEMTGSMVSENEATGEGAGIGIDNHGQVTVRDAQVLDNKTLMTGGGVENSGAKVTFERVMVKGNTAVGDGGGIHNSSSGEFTVLDTTMRENRGLSGGGFTNASDSTLVMKRSLIYNNTAKRPTFSEDPEEGGYGGGFYSISDGGGVMENTTISANRANVRGGGMFHDADASFKVVNTTVWRNSAPFGGGISTVESDFVPSIPPQPNALTLKNTIVAGSLEGGSCDWYVKSEGGNLAGPGHTCFIVVPGSDLQMGAVRDRQGADPELDALADNGGHTFTHAPRYGSLAIDGAHGVCPETDQRGVARPQNGRCDVGAFEFAGPPPPADEEAPDTQYVSGPTQDSLETMAWFFTGTDNLTPTDELIYECRLIEQDLTEAPEPQSPFEAVDPMFIFQSCSSGWRTPLLEEGLYTFEVRAIDRAGHEDPTPAQYTFNALDADPPETLIVEKPPLVTNSRAATFTFEGIDNGTPAPFMEFECRLDSRDPELWLECFNPSLYSNLTTGQHTLEVRATNAAEIVDPTPARYTWTVGVPTNCDQANVTLTPSADGWVDEVNPTENYLFEQELEVRSDATGNPEAQPPEPVVGQNARALFRFPLNNDAPDCELESATLRLHAGSMTEGRILEARPLAGTFKESTLTWMSQPGTLNAAPAQTEAGEGYREWDVQAHVEAMWEAGESYGWQIRDSHESDLVDGGDQSFASRETPQDPPEITLPELRLRFAADPAPPPPPPEMDPGTVPTQVHCGQVLTEDTIVGNDLDNCPGEGLVVGASNIVVDLNGHTIDGPDYLIANATGQEEGFPAGIRVSNRTNVLIKNGTVQQFGWGVLLTGGTTHTVIDNVNSFGHAVAGVELFDADDGRSGNTIQNSKIADNELGVLLGAGSENSVVRDNQIHGNLGEQIFIHNSHGHLIENNTMHGIPTDPNLDSDGGVLLEGASENVLRNNTVHDTGDAGVLMVLGSNRNLVEGGTYYRNGDAGVIIGDSDRNKIVGITSHQQSDGGVVLGRANHTEVRDSDLRFNPSGIEASSSNGLLIERNDASDSLQTGFEIGDGVGIRIFDNVADRSGGDGIGMEGAAFDALGSPVGGAVIAGNRTNQNGQSGILVADGGHTIRDNEAYNNAGFGIDAGENPAFPGGPFPGTNVDGGGNKASGNVEVEQCRGVTCDTGVAPPPVSDDITPPVTVITQDPGPVSGGDVTFEFTANDQTPDGAAFSPVTAMAFECRLDPGPDPLPEPQEPDLEPPDPGQPPDIDTPPDGEGWTECTSPINFKDLDEGEHLFQVRAIDAADLKDITPAEHRWNVELVPVDEPAGLLDPETTITSAPPAVTTATTATFRFTGSDDTTPGEHLRYECKLDPAGPDAGAWETCASPRTYTGLEPGVHNFQVRAIDRWGNADPVPAAVAWTIQAPPPDVTDPETTIDSGPDRTTVLRDATFTFSSNEQNVTFECKLDTATDWSDCSSPHALTGVSVGDRVLQVRAIDAAGNVDETPASYDWTISAAPTPTFVHCGMQVNHSILVRNDLVDCLFDGLVVNANGITIDLDGHTIDGKGLGAGVRNKGFDNVTIKNGRIVDYDWGVALNTGTRRNVVENIAPEMTQEAAIALGHIAEPDPALPVEPPDPFPSADSGVRENIIRNNTIIGNNRGVWMTANTQGTLITGNSLTATSDDAIWIERSHHNTVRGNELHASSGAGVSLEGSDFNVVEDNDLEANNGGVKLDVTHTPPVDVPSNDNRIEGNLIEESGGIEIIESERNHVIDNVVARSTDSGVSLDFANETVVRDNDLRTNKNGIALKSSTGNTFEANNASDSEGTGITLESGSFNNDLLRNESSNNDGDGVYIGVEAPAGTGIVLDGNITNNNKGYGLYVPKPAHIIKNNSAHDNGGWGIYAGVPSNGNQNVDAGGNRAQGNLGPLDPITLMPQQCHLVECAGGPPIAADIVPPDTQLLERPSNPSTSDVAVFRFTGNDNASDVTFQCSLDGTPESESFTPCSSPAAFENLAIGVHHFKVRAVDASGNVDTSPASYTWTVGAQPVGEPPETTIESSPDLTTVNTDATFEFNASERNATFECQLDNLGWAPCNWTGAPSVLTGTRGSISYTGLSVGTHTFEVRAVDLDSNVDQTPATYSWRVTDPPVPTPGVCGEFVTQSIMLTSDMLDCPGHGLIVGANDITIDLNGHAVDGTGLEAGVLNNGFDSVTITGGQIHQFDYGVQLSPGASQNVVHGVRVENNQEAGISLADADQDGQGNTIRDNVILGNKWGVALTSGTRHAVVRDNDFASNADTAVHMEQASQNLVTHNEIVRSSGPGVFMQGGGQNTVVDNFMDGNAAGVMVGEELIPSNNNVVRQNTIQRSNGPGVVVSDSLGTQVENNTIRETNGAGISLDIAHNTVVRGNDLRSAGAGIELSESTGNLVQDNNAGGTLGSGISLELSFANDIVDNQASGNGGDGIEVGDSAPAGQTNLIARNVTDSNGGDGIIVVGAGHTLTQNTAMLNGGWGIYAPVGAIDGGGNFAAGNMEPGQCVGVVCSIGAAPGEPETWFVDTPPAVSNSRNASFTYMGRDDSTPLVNLVFECRLDSTNDLAWEDCEYPHEVMNLSPGMHRLDIRAVDIGVLADSTPASYTWEYRPLPANDPPETFIDMKPEAETWLMESIFTFHSNEPDVSFECKVDFHPWETCGFDTVTHMNQGGFEWGLQETEVGNHTFHVRATDFEGNVGPTETYTWKLLGVFTNFTAGPGFTPGLEGEPATGGEVQSSDATIHFEANVADATYECSLDLEPFTPCTSPVHYTGLLPGEHLLQVIATDQNGVEQVEASEYEWEVLEPFDNTPPQTTLERMPADGSSSTIFEFSGTDDQTPPSLITFECRIDSTNDLDWEACTSPYNLLDHYTYADFQLAPGQHVFEVRAVDAFEPLVPDPSNPDFEGNVDPSPVSYTWTSTPDGDAPGTGITVGPSGKTAETEATFEFFGTDNATPAHLMDFECSLDGAPFEPCTTPETVSVEPGVHTFSIRSLDLAGNVDGSPATRTWEVVSAPVATITSGPEGRILPGQTVPPAPSLEDRAIFTFTSDQPDATFQCSLDGAEFEPCTSPYAAWLVEPGEHQLEVRGVSPLRTVDGELIVQEPATVYEWLTEFGPDLTRPDTTITSGPPASTLSQIATFQFSGSDNRTPNSQMRFECALDPGTAPPAWNSCVPGQQFSDLTHGTHELLVRAIDVANNVDSTPARYEWTVALPPVVTIQTGPEDVTESTDANFTFSSNVPGSTFKCWLDGVIQENCSSPKSYSGLAGGDHLFAVLATSPSGHTGLQWEEWEWTVGQTEAPITTFGSTPDATTNDTRAEFTFTANKPGARFECSLDGANFVPCTSPLVYPRLHAGQHRLEVQAFSPPLLDPQGVPVEPDYDPVPVAFEWEIIDDIAPNTSIDWGPRATTASLIAVFGLSSDDPTALLECSLDGGGYSECDPVAEFTDLDRGPHTLRVRARDPIGNVDTTPASYDWTITEPGPPNTPVGTNVTVTVPMPDGPGNATVNFFSVSQTGSTTVDALTGGPELPPGYTQGGARFYDVGTTAEFSEPVSMCFAYDPARYQTSAVRLLMADGTTWLDVTTTNNPFIGKICANDAELGSGESAIFTIAAANSGIAPLVSIISGPPPIANTGTATFELFADMPDSQIQCSIDGLPFERCESPVTYTHLETGDHDFQVQALSAFGIPPLVPTLYEWEVVLPPDTTPPNTTITKGPPAITGSFINWLEFTGFDDQTHELELDFECRVDDGVWESCSVPEEVEVLTRGDHWVEVRAIDETGNVDPTPARRDFSVVDLSVPDTSIDTGPNSETTETSASFTYTGEEELTGEAVNEFECALDDGEYVDCSNQPYTVTGLSGGPHVMYVRAVDPDGNRDPSPDFYEWLVTAPVDTTAPDTVIFSGPAEGSVSGADVMFGFLSTEIASEFECQLDNGPWEGCEAVHELVGLATGSHTLSVRALDIAEPPNVDASPAVRNWTVLGVPDTQIDSRPTDPSFGGSGTFTFSSDQTAEDGVTFQCSVDGSEWTPCSAPFTAGPLATGDPESGEEHEFEVRAVSRFTNIDGEPLYDESPASYSWTVFPQPDPPAFDTVFTSTPAEATAGGPDAIYLFSFEARFDGAPTNWAFFECSLDGEPWEECEPPLELDGLADGEHELRVRAVDPSLVPDSTPATFRWTIEPAPETVLSTVGLPPAETDSTTETFTFSSPSANASFECAFDTTVFTPCSSPYTITVPHGDHELQIRAKSPAGSVDQTPEVHTWTSGDMTPPTVTITSAPTATSGVEFTTASTSATFTWTSDDPEAQFLCTLSGHPDPVPVTHASRFCESGVTYDNLAPGLPYSFEVEPTKEFLLVSAEPALWEWSITDQTPPETTVESGPAARILPDAPAVFTFSSSEANATFECALDTPAGEEPAWGGCPETATHHADYSGLEAGEHVLLVRAVDLADPPNADPSPAEYRWTVIGAPTTTITSGPPVEPATTESRSATFEFSSNQENVTFRCSLDGLPSVPCSSPYTIDNLIAGEHVLEIQGTNEHDMVEEPAVEYAWTITDTVAPETSIELGPPSATSSRTATFTFSSNEADAVYECALDTPAGQEPAWNECAQAPENTAEFTDLALGGHELLVRAVDPSGNADASPEAYAWTVTPAGPPNTPVGTGVTVQAQTLGGGSTATVTYGNVTAAGFTMVDSLDGAAPLPAGYLAGGARFFDVFTTATHLGSLTVCLTYNPSELAEAVRLLHFDGSVWNDVTTTNDRSAGQICAEPGNLGAFAIARATTDVVPETSISSAPEDPTVKTAVEFAFEAESPLLAVDFECSLDEPVVEWGSCEALQLFEGLLPGEHELLVRAVNENGLADATPSRHAWTQVSLDTVIESGPPEATESTTAEFQFSTDFPGATFECLLDDATEWVACDPQTTYTGLLAEEHSLLVRAKTPEGDVDDIPAEWEWEVGEVPPPVTLDSHPAATTESQSANFTFSTSETVSFECSLDGAEFTICSTPKQYNGLPLGEHTFRVQVHSPESIIEQVPATWTWTVADQTAPETTIDFGPPAVTGNDAANVLFSASEQDATFECSLNDAAYTPCSSPAGYSALTPGDYEFRVRALDASGNRDQTPATHEWTVVARPDTTITLGPGSDTGTSATFEFTSNQPGSTFECSLDAGAFLSCSSPHVIENLLDGDHTLAVRARNAQGVEDLDPAEHDWHVELPPDTTIVEKPAAVTEVTNDRNGFFTFGSNEAEVSFECSLDGSAFAECLNPHSVMVEPGTHTLLVRAVDSASNVDETPASWTWRVDEVAPQTTITDVTAGSVIFHFEADEPGVYFQCSLDGADFEECESPVRYADLDAGDHTFEVRAVDLAGNIDPTPAKYRWAGNSPDETAPETTLETRLDPVTQANEASFNFESESGATFECSLDGSAWEPCQAPREYTGLDAGDHEFKVRAVDGAHNPDTSPASYSWTIDTAAPDTIVETRLDPVTEANEASFNFEAPGEPDARFECSLDQGDWETCVAPREYTGLSVGNHEFRARAVDQAGNADASPASYEWTIEPPSVVAPETTIDAQPDATTISSSASFAFSSNVAGSTFECSLDNSAWEACSSPAEYTGLALGAHELKVRATDPAGTPDGSPASYSWTVETPPNCSSAPLIAAAAADSWNGQTAPSTNHGTEATTRVISRQAQRARALVRFANPDIPQGCEIESATMRLYSSTVKSGRTLQAQRLGGPWTETGVNWNTQPTATGATANAPSRSSAGYVEWNVTDLVQAQYDSGSNHGFLIRDAVETASSTQEQRFASRETTTGNVPELVIRLKAPAPPDTTAPETTLGAGAPDATTTSTNASFAFSSDDAGASFECALDSGSYEPCSSPKQYSDVAVGAHEFRVRAVDEAGNRDDSPATHSWTVEAPPTPACDGTPLTASALADSWNGQTAASTNHGGDTVLRVNARSGQRDRTLIKFDNPVLGEGCTVASAKLRLYSSSFKSGRTLHAYRLGASWAEGGVNWNTQPMPTGAAASAPSRSSAGWVEWTVTAQVQAMYDAGSNDGFLIRDANEGGSTNQVQQFHSRETTSGNAPQLVLTFE